MALTGIGLLVLTPSIYIHPSTVSNGQLFRLTLPQLRQTSLATLWGSAASFGIASYLFQWISKQQHQLVSSRLDKQLHFGLLVFCTLGLVAIPGEFGMKLIMMDALASSPSVPSLPKIMPQWISMVGLLVATMARIAGFWTAIYGLQGVASQSTPTSSSPLSTTETIDTTTTTFMVQSDQIQKSPEKSTEPSPSLRYQKKQNWFQRLWLVPKSYRKQTLFYRNILLVLMTAAGSNLMEALFRWRYRSALAQPFSALDISLSLSAGARLLFFTILMYALKVGSESLPPLLLPTKSWNRNSRLQQSLPNKNDNDNNNKPSLPQEEEEEEEEEEENSFNPKDHVSQSFISITTNPPTWTISQRHLAKSLSKVNLLVAMWALVVALGQQTMSRQPMRSVAKPEMLLLAGLLTIKSYRLWSCQRQGKDTSPTTS